MVRTGPPYRVIEGETDMGIPETKRVGGCTCRCNVCKGGTHCRNIGSGCKVKL